MQVCPHVSPNVYKCVMFSTIISGRLHFFSSCRLREQHEQLLRNTRLLYSDRLDTHRISALNRFCFLPSGCLWLTNLHALFVFIFSALICQVRNTFDLYLLLL